jgi:HD-like signal output (HDOD) protein
MGADHCAVGGLLATRWKFPEDVKQAILDHHTILTCEADLTCLSAVVQIAHYLADTTGYQETPGRLENPAGIVADHIKQ